MYSSISCLASSNVLIFTLRIHSDFSMLKKFSAIALSYGFARLDIDGIMPYDFVRLKYSWEVY